MGEPLVEPHLQAVIIRIPDRLVAGDCRDISVRTAGIHIARPRARLVRPSPCPQLRIFVSDISGIKHKAGAKVMLNTKIPRLEVRSSRVRWNVSELHSSRGQTCRGMKPIPVLNVAAIDELVVKADKRRVDTEEYKLVKRLSLVKSTLPSLYTDVSEINNLAAFDPISIAANINPYSVYPANIRK